MYSFKNELSPGEISTLDKLYREAGNVSVYQHPLWPEPLQSNQGQRFFLQTEEDKIVLSAKITESHLTKAPFVKYANLHGGFICKEEARLLPAIKELFQQYKEQRFARLTVELACNLQDAEFVERSLFKEGFRFGHDLAAGARATLVLNLADDMDTIHSRFANVLKRNIITAQKKGAKVREATSAEDFEKFIAVYSKMEQARGVKLVAKNYLQGLFNFIRATGHGHFLACYDKTDTLIGGILLFNEGRRVQYIAGASHPEFKSIPQLHLALFEGIQLAKNKGNQFFDFGGFGFNEKEGSQVYGINQFKMQFGGQLTFYPKSIIFSTNERNAFIGETFLKMKNLFR